MKAPESTPPSPIDGRRGEVRNSRKKSREGGGGGANLGVLMDGFSPISPPKIFWNSRRKTSSGRSLQKAMDDEVEVKRPKSSSGNNSSGENSDEKKNKEAEEMFSMLGVESGGDHMMEEESYLSDKRRALFEPLEPSDGKRMRAEDLLPPPDFDSLSYPKGWLVGKKRKLVNVDVVESMRRIAVQEMNRKDREIDGLNEQLQEDGQCLERLQLQLLEEKSKRANVEREKAMLENQVAMLMEMLQEGEPIEDEDEPRHLP